MTNFEKWKENLTVQDYWKHTDCDECGAFGTCPGETDDQLCYEHFIPWAESEAES